MPVSPRDLLSRNRDWAEARRGQDPQFFERLSEQQAPRYFWVGCSDSRVPATQIVDIDPGEIFVHRNVANLCAHTDLNFLASLQFAVEVLRVEHVIVCGHYACGGVRAALGERSSGLVDHWIRSLRDLREHHRAILDGAIDRSEAADLLTELNVRTQVDNIAHNPIVQAAWRRGQKIEIHGWVYRVHDGILHDLDYRRSDHATVNDSHRISS
ncbi:MAG: carbonate dehydratase [Geminicoccaceae bacterium]|nr:carbonate dehydratase [Geminicoccaceae bacterium]MCB9945243.1 carbonate dehydratase [Geminicoccaceae bacterium]